MSGPVHVAVYGLTDVGRTREHNEDTFLVADLAQPRALPAGGQRLDVAPQGTVLLVADGMGGAAAGELASQMAAEQIHQFLVRSPLPVADEVEIGRHVREAVRHANTMIHEYAANHPDLQGMGTTATVAVVHQGALLLAQIGDSRAYLIRGGEAVQLTKDQSLTQRLVDAGELTEEQAERSERRNIILQALGPDPRVKVDVTHQPLQRGDALLLCSDGLSGLVKRHEMAAIVTPEAELEAACRALITLANERGGPDNVTVVLARFDGDGLPALGTIAPGHHRLLLDEDSAEIIAPVPSAGYVTSEIPGLPRPEVRPLGMWVMLGLGLLAAAAWVFLR